MGEEEAEGRGRRGKEGGREKGGREKEREREKREGSGTDRQAQLHHLGCLLASGVTTSSSLSAIWRATLYPPTRCLRMSYQVRLAALVGSFTAVSKSRCVRIANGNSHLVISASWQYAATCRAVSQPSPHAQTGYHVRTGRPRVLSSLFSSGRGGSVPLFEVRHAVSTILLPAVRLPFPQHGLDAWPLIGQPLNNRCKFYMLLLLHLSVLSIFRIRIHDVQMWLQSSGLQLDAQGIIR
jgi:hypothetical protein